MMIYLLGVLVCLCAPPTSPRESVRIRAGIALTWPASVPLLTLLLLLIGGEDA